MERKTSEEISKFLSFTRELSKEFEHISNEIDQKEAETQDILHQFEFGLARDRSRFATKLARIRRERRELKDFIDVNDGIAKYLKDPEFVKVYRRLEQLLGEVRKQEKYVESQRTYRPRVYKYWPFKHAEE